jgi:hypothetical protein
LPTYENIKPGDTKTSLFTGVNSLIALLPAEKSLLVSLPANGWNSLIESIIELYARLQEIDGLKDV